MTKTKEEYNVLDLKALIDEIEKLKAEALSNATEENIKELKMVLAVFINKVAEFINRR